MIVVPSPGDEEGRLALIVLGSAAGGGVPQWNCGCSICEAARLDPSLRNGQASLAVSADGGRHWFLVNASPDLRQQLMETPALHPRALRHSPVAGVILTNGEVDAIAGLLSMREGSPFTILAHPRVLGVLDANPIFDVLDRACVPRLALTPGVSFEPALPDGTPSGLLIEAFEVPGKAAWHMEGQGEAPGDTIGVTLRARGQAGAGGAAHVVTVCAGLTPALAERLRGADLVLFDGTLWRDDEMILAGLSQKTGRRMGHLSMSGEGGAIALLAPLSIRTKAFVHVNNSNPALRPGSPERRAIEAAGWTLPAPGERLPA